MKLFGTERLRLVVMVVVTGFASVALATEGFNGGRTNPENGVYNDFAYAPNWTSAANGLIGNNQIAHVVASIDTAGLPYNPVALLQLGYYTGSAGGIITGRGTLSVEGGTLATTGNTTLGKLKYGYGERTGTLNIVGGTLVTGRILSEGVVGINDINVISGTLDLGSGGSNHDITPAAGYNNITVLFSGGTIKNLSNGFITTLSGSGLVTNLTGVLKLDLAADSLFTGNIYGSGAGTITKTNSGVLTLAPDGLGKAGTMVIAGFASTTNIVFNFDITTPDGTNDLIMMGSGGFNVSPGTSISFGTTPTNLGSYSIFGGVTGQVAVTNFVLPTAPVGLEYFLSTNTHPSCIDLLVAIHVPHVDNASGPTGVTATAAWLNGTLLSFAEDLPEVTIFWGPSDGGSNMDLWATNIPMGNLSTGKFTYALSELLPGTQYFYRCYATNSYGFEWAPSTFTFETLSSVMATNGPATGIGLTNATIGAGIAAGGFGELRIYWGLTNGGQDFAAWENTNSFGIVQAGYPFSTSVQVRAGGLYYYRAYATNDVSEDWADVTATFTTAVAAVRLSTTPSTAIQETGGVATVTATLNELSASNVTVNFSFSGTATQNVDYTASATNVVIPAGSFSADMTLTATDDALQEEDRTVIVSIASAVFATNGSPRITTNTITSDDPKVTNNNGATGITQSNATLNGVLTMGDSAMITVFLGTSDGGTNQVAWSVTNSLGSRNEDVAFSTNVYGLTANKAYYYRCYATNSSLLFESWATNTVVFTTAPPSVVINDVSMMEGDSNQVDAVFSVSLLTLSAVDVAVTCSTTNGTAIAGLDYTATNAVVTIPAGQWSSTFIVKVLGDLSYVSTNEIFYVKLTSPTKCAIADATGVCTIVDNDLPFYLAGWRHKMKITFSGYDKPEILTNFPALVVLDGGSSGFDYAEMASQAGGDLRFANSNETLFLNYDIERWQWLGKSYVWVQVLQLADSNSCIWVYWGNPAVTNQLPCTTNGLTWSQGYTGVWHCATGAGTVVANARPTGVNGVLQHGGWDAASRIGGGLQVDGADPGVSVGALGFGGASARTVSGWVRQGAPSAASRSMFGFSGATGFDIGVGTNGTSWVANVAGWEGVIADADTSSQWHYLSATYDGNTVATYMDGVQYTNSVRGSLAVTDTFTFGDRGGWAGGLDEIRVSGVARSANWEWASWMTVASNRVFCSMKRIGAQGTSIIVR